MGTKAIVVRICACGALAACVAGARAQLPPQEPVTARPVPIANAPGYVTAPVAPAADYRLLPDDSVHIRVFHEDDLETTAHIGKDGTIPFPLLGTAKIGGQTVQEATATMESLLKEYLVHPEVFMEIADYSRRSFTILGQVNRPGAIDMPRGVTIDLLEAIGLAGGYTKLANPHRISVTRMVDGKENVIKLDGEKMLKDPDKQPDFEVLPGDTIMVEESLF
jgi:polysaccharide export outer membrane protein